MQEPLHIERAEGDVARLVLNRPKRGNSFDAALADALAAALDDLSHDTTLRALVLTGNGRNFCAGVDLAWMKESGGASYDANFRDALKLAKILHRLHCLPVPAIAAVNGPVIGMGVGLVAACDIAIASDAATFRFSEVRLGILPAVISPYAISAMGMRACQRYMLSAESFDAAEALSTGLVQAAVPAAELPVAVLRMLDELLAGKPEALAAVKSLLSRQRVPMLDDALIEDTARRLTEQRRTPEAQAALAAFLAK
jgi:methylglutaconyl-CoA hydratase